MSEDASAHPTDVPDTARCAELVALPVPQALDKSSSSLQKRRIKDIEGKLLEHKKTRCLDEDELFSLMHEMEQLRNELSHASGDSLEEEGGGVHRRLELKREIKEVERQIKQCKKLNCQDQKQLLACMEKLDDLKHELIQLQRHVIFSMQLSGITAGSSRHGITIALGDRVSLAGLSEMEATSLLRWFHRPVTCCDPWCLWRHSKLQVAALRSPDPPTLSDELQEAAVVCPHIICLHIACLKARGRIRTLLREFKGALILIEEPNQKMGELDTACLLHSVGIRDRWSKAETVSLARVAVPPTLQGDIIGDLKLRDVREDPMLASLFADVEKLYPEEFDDNLLELLSTEGVRLALLVPAGSVHKGAAGQPQMLGFIIYMFWGPPLKSMSISRVAVPQKYQMHGFGRVLVRWAIEKAKQKPRHECTRVSLLATSKAVPFYEHLNFTRTPDEEAEPHNSPGSVWMEYQCGRAIRH